MDLLYTIIYLAFISLCVCYQPKPGGKHTESAPISLLYKQVRGEVYQCCGGSRYEELRKVNNRACEAKPQVIIRPRDARDVATVVKFANRNSIWISMRSGGHGYTCNQLKVGAILLDLRSLNMIEFPVFTKESSTGLAARLGPGSTWGRVQKKIPISRYSYPHGQCRSVGVGGYITGGGVNWLGTYNKYGYAAEHVLRMTMVTANGTILKLAPGKTTQIPDYSHERAITFRPGYDDDLFFAMRGAGAGFGIVTEFLYTIHKTPETLPAVFLVWASNPEELNRIQKSGYGSRKYSVSINNEFAGMFWESFQARLIYKFLPTFLSSLKLLHRSGDAPLFVTVTDISPNAGTETNTLEALRHLQRFNIRMVFDNPLIVRAVDKFARYLYELIIVEQENQVPGSYNLVSLNLGGMKDTRALHEVFFHHPVFGSKRKNLQKFNDIGCDYCFWTIHFRNRQKFLNPNYPISTNTDNNLKFGVDTNLVCLFSDRWSECPNYVLSVKASMENVLKNKELSYSKFFNFPSCDSTDWMWRYWGKNFNKLLAIKKKYDPKMMFNSCQTVGTKDNNCCPFTNDYPNRQPGYIPLKG